MYLIIAPSGERKNTDDTVTVKLAIDMNWTVFRNGKRVW